MQNYIGLIHKDADSDYGVSFPDFPGCITTADTLDDALARGAQVLAFHVEGMIEDGQAMPALRSAGQLQADAAEAEAFIDATLAAIPIELPSRAVRINISIDESLLQLLDGAAEAAGQSRSGFLAEAVRSFLKLRMQRGATSRPPPALPAPAKRGAAQVRPK